MARTTTKRTTASRRVSSTKKKNVSKKFNSPRLFTAKSLIVIMILIVVGVALLIRSYAAAPAPAANSNAAQRFPGDPNPKVSGKRYWGSGISGNGDPARHETSTGKSLSIRRTFQSSWNNRLNMVTIAKDDIAHNRLPYVSTKTPGWAETASGSRDAEIDDMLRKLDAAGGPVWLTVNHEPENDGGNPADWRAMQKHIRDRMNVVGTKNIAFMPTLMDWTWDPASKRNPEDWWVSGIWDSYMVDTYTPSEAGVPGTGKGWVNFVNWVEAKGLPFGTGEWGNYGTGANVSAEMRDFWNWSFTNNKDMLAYTYFDSDLNGGKMLSGAPLTTFQDILKNDVRVQRIKDLRVGSANTAISTNLVDGQTISGPYAVTVTAAAGVDVKSVNFRLNNVWQSADSAAPFTWTWNTTKFKNGAYSVVLRTRDSSNAVKDLTVTVTVKN